MARLALSIKELKRMVLLLPSVLTHSPESHLEPKLIWLEERMKLD